MYHGDMPGEMKHIIEDNPATRKLFKKTENRAQAGFEDAHNSDPDRYESIAGAYAGSPIKAALRTAENSNDPRMVLKAAIYKALPQDAAGMQSAATRAKNAVAAAGQNAATPGERARAKRVAQDKADHAQSQADAAKAENKPTEMKPVDNLPVGAKFNVHNIPVEVVNTPEGKSIRDHGDLPETPLDALQGEKLPVDKGSLKMPAKPSLEITPKHWADHPPRRDARHPREMRAIPSASTSTASMISGKPTAIRTFTRRFTIMRMSWNIRRRGRSRRMKPMRRT